MIEDPPLLKMRRDFPRPEAGAVDALAGVATGHLVDCMDGRGALDHAIRPLDADNAAFAAVAVTCHTGPDDNLAIFAALDALRPGDAIVAAADAFTTSAIVGDLLLGMARNAGAVAFVTDGLVRDTDGIRAVGLPTFSRGVTPNSCVRNGPGTVGLPVSLGNVPVHAGDIVVGDRDGVVVVPRADAARVAERLERVRAAEAEMEARVGAGLTLPEWLRELLGSERTQSLDRAPPARRD